jgi:sugar phosphate isomerase/epimerase
MEISICSYSFHRQLKAGEQDVFGYIEACRELGCTSLDLWNGHLSRLLGEPGRPAASYTLEDSRLSAEEEEYLAAIRRAAEAAQLPFGCLAVDGAHIYEESEAGRRANRIKGYRWLTIAKRLGARQVRIDSGGPAEMGDEPFEEIVNGFKELVERCGDMGMELVMENHWGASHVPENVIRILEAVPGLGLLLDTANWPDGRQEEGWARCARYARATHVKTYEFDAAGNETTVDVAKAVRLLLAAGYDGSWGIESVPRNGDEIAGARKSVALLRRVVKEAQAQ